MLKQLVQFDVLERFKETLLERGWFIDVKTKKITCHGMVGLNPNKYMWINVNPDTSRKCSVLQVIVEQFNFIPSPCLACWKVCVAPRTLYELIALKKFMDEFTEGYIHKDRFCKCGIEERDWVPRNYGGYFYCSSKEQGLIRYKQVRKAVDKINPEIPVSLKRYCTEFEIKLGPSDKYEWAEGTENLEKHIFNALDLRPLDDDAIQPDWMIAHNLAAWIKFAWGRGDPTAEAFNDNQPLYTPAVTYHNDVLDKAVEG
jgi:hypothetical protein